MDNKAFVLTKYEQIFIIPLPVILLFDRSKCLKVWFVINPGTNHFTISSSTKFPCKDKVKK